MDLIRTPDKALEWTTKVLSKVESDTWIIPQSGGKDSRSVAWSTLILIAERKITTPKRIVTYFADTLMEYPSFIKQAQQALDEFVEFAGNLGIEAHSFTTRPKPEHDFWVRIIGKGLVPPTGGMRWCTDMMKIQPPRDVLKKQGWFGNPVLLGVRYGESERRDKVLSCSVGGECGPDVMLRADKKVPKVQPIVRWSQCSVWDFLTLIAPGYGFDPQGLIDHYGPDGSLRYGCWSCPLVFNDKTGQYLSRFNPPLAELVNFANQQFRSGGAAWQTGNRELFSMDGNLKDGRLSLEYCKRLFDWIIDYEYRHGQPLLEGWQKSMIQGVWEYRRNQPKIQAGQNGQMLFDLKVKKMPGKPIRITNIKNKTASNLSQVNFIDDTYHNGIKISAKILTEQHPGITWLYTGQHSVVNWMSIGHEPQLWATWRGDSRKIDIEKAW